MQQHVTLGVVIPNHNGGVCLRESLDRLQAIPLVDKVVLVDDRSTDGSGRLVPNDKLVVLENHGRRGFAATSNVGINYLLREPPALYIAVANSDLEFDADFASALEMGVSYLESHPETYVCGFNDAIGASSDTARPAAGTAQVVAAVSGSLMLFRSSVFRHIGLMSEGYFMYGEELDYFDRMRRNGFQLVLIASPVRHAGEGSGLPGIQTTWLAHRNALRRAIKSFDLHVVAETLGSLIVMPWFRKGAVVRTDLSLMRTLRFGALAGSALGVAAAGWNLLHVATTVRERLAEDRIIVGQLGDEPPRVGTDRGSEGAGQ
jgi:GT2 family glycosyltransferase